MNTFEIALTCLLVGIVIGVVGWILLSNTLKNHVAALDNSVHAKIDALTNKVDTVVKATATPVPPPAPPA